MSAIEGLTAEESRGLNSAPFTRTSLNVDEDRNATTLPELIEELRAKYQDNEFALAQLSLLDPTSDIGVLRKEWIKVAKSKTDEEFEKSTMNLKKKLLDTFPGLGVLTDEQLDEFVDFGTVPKYDHNK